MSKYVVKDCPCLDNSDNITCQDCTQDNPGFEACINRNNCIIKKLILGYDSISDFNQNMKEITKGNEQLKKQLEFSRTHKTVLDAKRIKYKQAFEEIREILEFYANSWINPLYYPDLKYDNTKAREGLKMINEVLDD